MASRSGAVPGGTGGSSRGRASKRHHPAVFNGIGGSAEDRNNDYLCPICFDLIDEAHITRCGHTFCFKCICRSLEASSRCPKCGSPIPDIDSLFPNFLLNELVSKYRQRTSASGRAIQGVGESTEGTHEGGLRDFVASESRRLSLPDVNALLEVLTQRKHLLEAESCAAQNRLLHEFLRHLLRQKEEQLAQLGKEVALVRKDLAQVEAILRDVQEKCPKVNDSGIEEGATSQVEQPKERLITDTVALTEKPIKTEPCEMASEGAGAAISAGAPSSDGFNGNAKGDPASLAARRKRMHAHFDDFVQCYFASRAKELMFGPASIGEAEKVPVDGHGSGSSAGSEGLDLFRENLVKFSRYSTLRPLATLNYSSDIFNNSTIVSSIEFDKDNEFFAIAGVTKRIKVFEYGTVVRDAVDIHYPCVEMVSGSKISCVSWNAYHKGTLASSDYEGAVTIWDAGTGSRLHCFQEHERRCWSVDFNRVDARLVASGSDDARVKLWSLNAERSIASLEAKANVCCVKFNPKSSCHLAFGSADHCVHYYDLRHPHEPLAVFRGHRKAVSYVKFLNKEEIVSASTDSQLKMWSVGAVGGGSGSKMSGTAPSCLRSFVGHVNEKNFVGLATDGDYVACGSENNALYVYYKGLSKQLFSFKFDAVRSVLEKDRKEDDVNEFVSAVCWRQNSNVVVAANSQGIIKVLELV
ncbi:E3 ubiquitin-protein ligase COP1-like isoform X1 [Ischnura elegans]|uniref:E3 ubiquitin-protein ligase COP1-like isoform X1 n=1 Tax=Ischnura elegans TaxID=197161 RepID=UPI001ED896A1|nr:E3 ubiquitin-protein ligase COP1-like isoform X1 [Ischnura elegans]